MSKIRKGKKEENQHYVGNLRPILKDKDSTVQIRVSSEIKTSAEDVFSQVGLTMSDAVSLFLLRSIQDGGLPFPLKIDMPNEETILAMQESNEIIKKGKGHFEDVDAMFAELED